MEFRDDWDLVDNPPVSYLDGDGWQIVYDLDGIAWGGEVSFQDTPPARASLYTCHISPPKFEIYSGANLVTVRRSRIVSPSAQKKKCSKQRGKILGFSSKSRRRLRNTVAKVKKDLVPLFITLTYPAEMSEDFRFFKRDLKVFLQRLHRKFPDASGVWKLEPQKRGAPHFHIMLWGVEKNEYIKDNPRFGNFSDWVVFNWCEVAGSSDENHYKFHAGQFGNEHCVKVLPLGVAMRYISKYMSKSIDFAIADWGRWWGLFNAEFLPFGEKISFPIDKKTAQTIIRYLRRFAKIASRDYKSLTVIADADLWLRSMLW